MSDKNRGPIIIGNITSGRNTNISDGPMIINNADNDHGQRDHKRSDDGEDVNISTYRNGKRTDDDE